MGFKKSCSCARVPTTTILPPHKRSPSLTTDLHSPDRKHQVVEVTSSDDEASRPNGSGTQLGETPG